MDSNQQQHNDDGNERVAAGDLLVGADAVRDFLKSLGMPEGTDVYYLRRCGRWPIGNTGGSGAGGRLIASKKRLLHHLEQITRGPAADDEATEERV